MTAKELVRVIANLNGISNRFSAYAGMDDGCDRVSFTKTRLSEVAKEIRGYTRKLLELIPDQSVSLVDGEGDNLSIKTLVDRD